MAKSKESKGELPKLYSARQYATLIGKSRVEVWNLLKKGRLTRSQKVDGYWVVAEDAEIIPVGSHEDPLIAKYAKMFSTIPELREDVELPSRFIPSNPKGTDSSTTIRLPGFKRVREELGYSTREIKRRTRVHENTQKKAEAGLPVQATVAVRLAVGLDVDVSEFLK